jgi:hypothetical protein
MGRARLGIIALAAIACWAPAARAQRGAAYCNVTDIRADQLSNGVRITITADGQLAWDIEWDRLIAEGAIAVTEYAPGQYSFEPREQFRRLPIRIWNARSKLGSAYIDISRYPVSHATISIPDWAEEGVGLEIDLHNYLGWVAGEGRLLEVRYDLRVDRSDDGRSIIIAWGSNRFPPPAPPKTPEDLPAELRVTAHDGRVDVEAVNARLTDVVAAIAQECRFPVVAPLTDDVRVSACLRDATPTEAVEAVAMGCGMCARRLVNGEWVVAEAAGSGAGYGAMSERRINLRTLRAVDALDLLPGFLLRYLEADEEGNSILATGPPWLVDRVSEDLRKLDAPPPEVVIEAIAVEYTSSDALVRALRLERGAGDMLSAIQTLSGTLDFLWLKDLPAEWRLLLENLEVESTGRLRSRTVVRVLNGHQAFIFSGEQRYVVLESLSPESPANLQALDTGTRLSVLPLVGRGDEVMLGVEIVVRTLRGRDAETGLPILALRRANGVARVREGQTIALAGLQTEEVTRERRRIPLLGSLPVIGSFFQYPHHSRSETKLALFLTPRIIRPGEPARDIDGFGQAGAPPGERGGWSDG